MRKIMFNDKYGLTQAVLEGRKTQTRRIVNESLIDEYDNFLSDVMCISVPPGTTYEKIEDFLIRRSKYSVGEIVAIAQSYKDCGYDENALDISPKDYRISRGTLGNSKGWSNKMFVRADACKHQIRITNVRIQRLQDISEDDCLKEGVVVNEPKIKGAAKSYYPCEYLKECANRVGWGRVYNTPREAYSVLIDKVGKKGTWDSNPYVFLYDFELVK